MRLEKLTRKEEQSWREKFGEHNWTLAALTLNLTLPEFAAQDAPPESMPFGYYLQPLHLNVNDREELPRKLLAVLARRRPPLDFLELMGAGIRIPHAFPHGFTLGSVLRITLLELSRIPLEGG